MSDRLPPTDLLDEFLNDLAEDVLHLSDEELRAELLEDGESLDDHSERFQAAVRAAESRLRPRAPAADANRVAARLVADSPSSPSSDVQAIHDPFGESKWGPRPVHRYAGEIEALLDLMPEFETAPFGGGATMEEHPDLMQVVRKPMREMPKMPVAVVSRKYTLVQHRDAVSMCLRGLQSACLDSGEVRGELALSELGEWMGFSFVLPPEFSFRDTYGHEVEFRCDIANSVDGSSRLAVWFEWFRQVCSNGMVVQEKRHESTKHLGLELNAVEKRVFDGFHAAKHDRETLSRWHETRVHRRALEDWVDGDLGKQWGIHAAGRVYSICRSGNDTQFEVGATGPPTTLVDQPVSLFGSRQRRHARPRNRVPGSPEIANTKYDVAQAMSWVASRKTNIVTRVRHQEQIPALLERLQAA